MRSELLHDVHRASRTVLVGAVVGILTVGVLGRVAMFVLARTNPSAAGMRTDDGFTIDRFTLSGSLHLALIGLLLGAFSGLVHVALAPLAFGPVWFRRLSLSVGAGVVAATQVVHADGIDFVALDRPFLLAVGMFVVIPVLHVLVLDVVAGRVHERGGSRGPVWTVLGMLCSVPVLFVAVPLLLGRAAWLAVPRESRVGTALRLPVWPWTLRAGLAGLFAVAVASIGADVAAVT